MAKKKSAKKPAKPRWRIVLITKNLNRVKPATFPGTYDSEIEAQRDILHRAHWTLQEHYKVEKV